MGSLEINLAAMTHNGAVRTANQDRIAIDSWSSGESMTEPLGMVIPVDRPRLLLVCDGMGGQASGEVASEMAVKMLQDALAQGSDEDGIASALQEVSITIHEAAVADPGLQWMGTTAAGLLLGPEGGYWFNVGDSAVFRYRGALMKQSLDDVPPGERSGQLTQALGGTAAATVINPHVEDIHVAAGVTFLLCSDGLTDVLSFDEIESCLELPPAEAAMSLVDSVVAAGGSDNVSVLIVRVQEIEEGASEDGSQD